MSDVYTIVRCGVEDVETLARYGVEEGSVDTVLSVQVLCSVPKPRESIRGLYGLLREGGVMVVYEHVGSCDGVSRVIAG